MQENLRKQVKPLKALQNIPYSEIAEYLEISKNSFYNWLKNYYDFGTEKEQRLIEIINNLSDNEMR